MPGKIYFRIFYCLKCKQLYTKDRRGLTCCDGNDFEYCTIEATIYNNEIKLIIVPGELKFNI